ncbi:MAG: GNAT family N-acetyltransferase [Halofilum sp. (in: g-proteobacteria)]
MSLIVAEQNSPARRLYERLGYRDAARRARMFFPGFPHEGDWLLMRKDLA